METQTGPSSCNTVFQCCSLTYAMTHPSRVRALWLRGIFMCRRSELLWFYQVCSVVNHHTMFCKKRLSDFLTPICLTTTNKS